MCAWTHTDTFNEGEAEPALLVIAETINERLSFNPEGFSASLTEELTQWMCLGEGGTSWG